MFDRYVIVDGSLKNVEGGYELQGRIPYYRGLGLSMVDVDLTVDGALVAPEAVTFTVHGNSYRSDQLGEIYDDRWGFTEPATLTVAAPGGLDAGPHEVELRVRLRVSYNPHGSGATDQKTLTVS
jgi:hypothetical protein